MVRLQSSPVEGQLEYHQVRYGMQKVGNLEIFYRERRAIRVTLLLFYCMGSPPPLTCTAKFCGL